MQLNIEKVFSEYCSLIEDRLVIDSLPIIQLLKKMKVVIEVYLLLNQDSNQSKVKNQLSKWLFQTALVFPTCSLLATVVILLLQRGADPNISISDSKSTRDIISKSSQSPQSKELLRLLELDQTTLKEMKFNITADKQLKETNFGLPLDTEEKLLAYCKNLADNADPYLTIIMEQITNNLAINKIAKLNISDEIKPNDENTNANANATSRPNQKECTILLRLQSTFMKPDKFKEICVELTSVCNGDYTRVRETLVKIGYLLCCQYNDENLRQLVVTFPEVMKGGCIQTSIILKNKCEATFGLNLLDFLLMWRFIPSKTMSQYNAMVLALLERNFFNPVSLLAIFLSRTLQRASGLPINYDWLFEPIVPIKTSKEKSKKIYPLEFAVSTYHFEFCQNALENSSNNLITLLRDGRGLSMAWDAMQYLPRFDLTNDNQEIPYPILLKFIFTLLKRQFIILDINNISLEEKSRMLLEHFENSTNYLVFLTLLLQHNQVKIFRILSEIPLPHQFSEFPLMSRELSKTDNPKFVDNVSIVTQAILLIDDGQVDIEILEHLICGMHLPVNKTNDLEFKTPLTAAIGCKNKEMRLKILSLLLNNNVMLDITDQLDNNNNNEPSPDISFTAMFKDKQDNVHYVYVKSRDSSLMENLNKVLSDTFKGNFAKIKDIEGNPKYRNSLYKSDPLYKVKIPNGEKAGHSKLIFFRPNEPKKIQVDNEEIQIDFIAEMR